MKKLIAAITIASAIAASAFAIDISNGLSLGISSLQTKTTLGSIEDKSVGNYASFGGFSDITYIVAEAGFTYLIGLSSNGTPVEDYQRACVYGSLMGKYPVSLGFFTLAPVAGLEINRVIYAAQNGSSIDVSDADFTFWLKGGVAADFSLGGSMYMRPMAIVGYRFLTENEKDVVEAYDALGLDYSRVPLRFDFSISFGRKL